MTRNISNEQLTVIWIVGVAISATLFYFGWFEVAFGNHGVGAVFLTVIAPILILGACGYLTVVRAGRQ